MPSSLKLRIVPVDISDILLVHGFLQTVASALNGTLLLCRNLIAIFLKVLLSLEDHCICIVDLVNPFLLSLVGLLVGLGLITHSLDLLITQTA